MSLGNFHDISEINVWQNIHQLRDVVGVVVVEFNILELAVPSSTFIRLQQVVQKP